MAKKILAITLAIIMVLGCMPIAGATEVPTFTDMPDDWSTAALESAVANGLLIGDGGKIMPESPVTRAQMATIVARAFGATEEGDISGYTDVKSTDWYAGSIAKAYKMGVMEGYAGLMDPDKNITREQAFAVLARALKLESASTMNKTFEDSGEISDWAVGEINAMVNAGYIQGSDGKLNPQANIRRNEFAQVMYNLTNQYISTEGEYTEVVDGNLIINVPGVTLKGVTVKGDLIIGDGVGDGEVILEDVIIEGRLLIRGGGENSVIIRGSSSVSQVIVARVDGVVRVHVEGDADVEVIYIDDGSDDVIVEGTIGSIELAAGNVTVTATNAKMSEANVSGNNSKIIVDAGSSIGTITTSGANTSVTGPGKVGKVVVEPGGDGAKIETGDTEITVGDGVEDVTAGGGTPVEGGSTATNNADGTDLAEDDTPVVPAPVAVSAISVNKTETTLTVGASETLVATVLPSNATNKTVTWTSSDTNVATVGSNGLVTAVAVGEATITAKAGNFEATTKVTAVDKSALTTALGSANTKHDNAVEGIEVGEYAAGSKATFKAAIDVAQGVADDANATQAQINQAVSDLATAEGTFDAAKVTAAQKLSAAKVTAKGELNSYVDAADYTTNADDLTSAVDAGELAIDGATTTGEVDTALANAKAAIDLIKTDAELAAGELATAKGTITGLTYTDLVVENMENATKKAAVEAVVNAASLPDGVTATVNADGSQVTLSKALADDVVVDTSATFKLSDDAQAALDAQAFKTTHATILAKTVETVAIDDRALVEAALGAYGNLSSEAQAKLVDGEKALLDNLLVKIGELEAAAALAEAKVTRKAAADALLDDLTQADYTAASWSALTGAIAADKAAIDLLETVGAVEGYTLTATAAKEALVTKAAADDAAVKAFDALDTKYALKTDAEAAILAVAINGTLAETTITWEGMVATVTLNEGTVDLTFTRIQEVNWSAMIKVQYKIAEKWDKINT